jgi:hypothetical protein
MIRAKFRCDSVETYDLGAGVVNEHVRFDAAIDDGNKSWSEWTPSGQLSMTISNPQAQGKFQEGSFYYLDFSEAPAEE